MKPTSHLFDRIRVKRDEAPRPAEGPRCDRPGCMNPGMHRAPRGRGREGQFFTFCLDHVKEYNASYNYFAGMSDDAVAAWQKSAQTGHRPTWKMGVNGQPGAEAAQAETVVDPFELFGAFASRGPSARADAPMPEQRSVRNAERKALAQLGLDTDATGPGIKQRFKELVKIYHPDTNGGDRSTEDRLREVIQAYNYLKGAGLV
jgi:hypothetical protein